VFDCDLGTGYWIIVLGNCDPPAAQEVARTIRRTLSGVTK
jgi:hypothetical protein